MLTEIIGYLAMAGVLISFFMKDIKMLRIINTIGCGFFVIYGFM
ncbi:MAG: uroporphyrinogen decarboxylase, partial [Bacteroidetes bacterium]